MNLYPDLLNLAIDHFGSLLWSLYLTMIVTVLIAGRQPNCKVIQGVSLIR
jgi:hypothetical protein